MEVVLDWRSVGSLIATVMLLRSAVRDVLPPEVELYLRRLLTWIATAFWGAQGTIHIDEIDGSRGGPNDLYDAAQLYLGARCLATAPTVRLQKSREAQRPIATLPDLDTTIYDTFDAVRVRWTTTERVGTEEGRGSSSKQRSLELQFPRQHRDLIHNHYIPHLVDEATKVRLKSRERRLYTNRASASGFGEEYHHRMWTSHEFSHPSTFDTLALDPALREDIRADLLRFVARREYYVRAGRAWKRGYLLHGPPGTGKTSLVAAIANLLEFDVYDLELTTVSTNTHLRRLLMSTTPKSVVVIEDIDCSLDLSERRTRKGGTDTTDDTEMAAPVGHESISLSGVLNFLDGLWSSCIGERLMVLTTNHPERLDPALLRPGRMDRKIELGYCSPAALRVLANNYLLDMDADTQTVHKLIAEAEQLLATVQITPADIAEVFMGCDGAGATAALRKLVDQLQRRLDVATAKAD